jgi:hypothetical protein
MKRIAAFLASLALVAGSARAQDDEDASYSRGQKYLEKVAKAWTSHLPREQLCGIYIGRQWVGSFVLSVKANSEKGAAFEMSIKGGLTAFNRTLEIESHSVYTSALSPVSSESKETSDGKVEKKTVTVADGAWVFKGEKDGDITEKKGKVHPGTTLEVSFLPLFASPDDESLLLDSAESKKTLCKVRKLADLRERMVDGKKEKCSVLEIGHPGEAADQWFFRSDGAPLEFQAGDAPIRVRPIAEAEKGKPLNEPLDLKPSERRLVDLFVGIAKNDAKAVSACFDFQRFSSESVPGFADLSEDKKKEIVKAMEAELGKNLLSAEMRSMFPDPALVEDAVANGMKTTEKDGVARIQMFGQQTWKLYEVKEGPRKGQWLIFGIEQQ